MTQGNAQPEPEPPLNPADGAMPMPNGNAPVGSPGMRPGTSQATSPGTSPDAVGSENPEPIVIAAPPSVGRQALQLVLIPAAIVICAVSVAILFAKLAGSTENIDTQLMKLRESSGEGRMALNLQDPRYKNRSMAAYNIATMIPAIKDPAERKRVSGELVDILDHNLSAESEVDDKLYVYVLSAVGQLGQTDGLDAIVKRLSMSNARSLVKEGAIRGLLSWPREEEVRPNARLLVPLLRDQDVNVSAMAAAALGQLGDGSDKATVAGLRDAMGAIGEKQRDLSWNSAVALARLGDDAGSRFVVSVLLNRDALAKIPVDSTQIRPGETAGATLPTNVQDQVILSTLAASVTMSEPVVREKIEELGKNDPSFAVRKAAAMVIERRESRSSSKDAAAPPALPPLAEPQPRR